jgi:hypothetical protein
MSDPLHPLLADARDANANDVRVIGGGHISPKVGGQPIIDVVISAPVILKR